MFFGGLIVQLAESIPFALLVAQLLNISIKYFIKYFLL